MNVSRETHDRLNQYVDLLLEENGRQNLIGKTTENEVWQRHVEDALQLAPMIAGDSIVDIGSGPGLPGIILALTTGKPTTLVEPRRRRVEFLEHVVGVLDLPNVEIVQAKSSSVVGKFDTITARAVAELSTLLDWTWHLAHSGTRFVLPKGRSAKTELESATRAWQGNFRLEQSRTSDEAYIIVADQVRPRGKR